MGRLFSIFLIRQRIKEIPNYTFCKSFTKGFVLGVASATSKTSVGEMEGDRKERNYDGLLVDGWKPWPSCSLFHGEQ